VLGVAADMVYRSPSLLQRRITRRVLRRSPYLPPRSRPSRRGNDREPGEVSSGSCLEESGGRPLKAGVPIEDVFLGVCKDGSVLPPSKKRKHSPVVLDTHVSKLQAIDDVRSRGVVDTAAAEFPLPSPPP